MLLGGLPWQVRAVVGVGLLAFVGYRVSQHQTGTSTVVLGIAGIAVLLLALAGSRQDKARR